jgi:50S ribosomal subunit-associated GTPase HflX
MSAKSGEGAAQLIETLLRLLSADRREYALRIPYRDAGAVDLLKREAVVRSMEYTEEGILLSAMVTPEIYGKIKQYIADESGSGRG